LDFKNLFLPRNKKEIIYRALTSKSSANVRVNCSHQNNEFDVNMCLEKPPFQITVLFFLSRISNMVSYFYCFPSAVRNFIGSAPNAYLEVAVGVYRHLAYFPLTLLLP
jgi:hypothetical protein